VILLLLLLLALPSRAHVGAPYVVLLDEEVGRQKLTVWSDPDVGNGSFYLVANEGDPPPARLWVTPRDGHAGESGPYSTTGQVWARKNAQAAFIPFDREGDWVVRMEVEGSILKFPVLVTPPGPGWLAWVLGLGPCLLLAGLWWWGARRAQTRRATLP
jgi:hypothetical protein